MTRAVLALAILLSGVPVVLAEPCRTAVEVETPCAGLLVPRAEALRALRCMREDLPECIRQLVKERETCASDLRSANDIAEERLADCRRRADADEAAYALCSDEVIRLANETAAARNPPLWKSPWLWAGVGVVVGGVAGYAIASAF